MMNSALWKTLMIVRRCDKKAFGLRILYVVLQSMLPLLSLLVLKSLIDEVTAVVAHTSAGVGDSKMVMGLTVAFAVLFLLNRWVSTLSSVQMDVLSQRLIDYMGNLIQTQSARLDMAYYDNPYFHDTFHRAQQESSYRPLQLFNAFMSLFGAVLSLLMVGGMMLFASWEVIVIMVVSGIPAFVVKLYKSKTIYAFRRNHTQDYRRTSYYSAVLSGRDFAKEVRLFGLSPYFRKLYVAQRESLVGQILRISRSIAWRDVLCSVVEAAALLGVMYFLIRGAFAGAITVGLFVMLFEAFRRGLSALQSLTTSIASLYDCRLFANNIYEFLDLNPVIVSPDDPVPFPATVESVVFDDVTFRYPDMERDVLSHFSLSASRGEVTLVEGENGFGKTTALKLLLRLYDPSAGTIRINGTDIRRFDLTELRRGVRVIFQDFVRFNCTLRENICFGDIGSSVDEDRMLWAASMSGVDGIAASLPKQYDTMLGRMFDGGAELSMGQWQRVALARQLYGDAPILFFDEATAWMDAAMRQQFYAAVESLKGERVIIMVRHK